MNSIILILEFTGVAILLFVIVLALAHLFGYDVFYDRMIGYKNEEDDSENNAGKDDNALNETDDGYIT
jgi:hypothetical protein